MFCKVGQGVQSDEVTGVFAFFVKDDAVGYNMTKQRGCRDVDDNGNKHRGCQESEVSE